MIGLTRGTVKLVRHDRRWAAAFEHEKERLLARVGALAVDIQHVGSTAVPGLHAKPIIDMSLGLRRLKDVRKLVKPLDRMGYHFYKKFGDQVLFAKGPDRKRTHYLHVMRFNGPKWKSDLLFRDFLRAHGTHAHAYARLKQKLAKRYPDDRERYTAGKKSFIDSIKKLVKNRL